MIFTTIEPHDNTGALLPQDAQDIYQCTFSGDISETLTLVPIIDDEGIAQDVRMETVVPDQNFYEFVAEDPHKRVDNFNSAQSFSFDFKIRRKTQTGTIIPCRIRSTLFFYVVVNGQKKQSQRVQTMFIQ